MNHITVVPRTPAATADARIITLAVVIAIAGFVLATAVSHSGNKWAARAIDVAVVASLLGLYFHEHG